MRFLVKNAPKPTMGRPGEQQLAVKCGDPKNGIVVRVRRSGMTSYWRRKTTEAILIKQSEETMNLDGGLQLPTLWNPVLSPP